MTKYQTIWTILGASSELGEVLKVQPSHFCQNVEFPTALAPITLLNNTPLQQGSAVEVA